jgi:hypothetical protein
MGGGGGWGSTEKTTIQEEILASKPLAKTHLKTVGVELRLVVTPANQNQQRHKI